MLRPATEDDFAPLTMLWAEGWDAGHLDHAPKALIKLRTAESFRLRLRGFGDDLQVIGPRGAPTGFVAFKKNSIDQFYLRADQIGTGLASELLAAAETELLNRGHKTGRLDCGVGNDRARRFYNKCGWEEMGIEDASVDTSKGPFILPLILFFKEL